MSRSTERQGSQASASLAFSVRRSLVTPYVPYTVYVLAYCVFGVALGSAVSDQFRPGLAVAVGASIWFGLEGLHAIDLADEGVAVRLDNTVANRLGYAQLLLGVAIGLGLAWLVTPWYAVIILIGGVFGLAYNEEWFDGLLHDRDKVTGLANFGLTWGAVPFCAGYFLLSPSLSVGPFLVAAGISIDAIRLNYLEGHGKLPRYEDVGIEHARDHPSSGDEARAACHMANVINLFAWGLVAAGTTTLFVL